MRRGSATSARQGYGNVDSRTSGEPGTWRPRMGSCESIRTAPDDGVENRHNRGVARFTHLAREKDSTRILRSGIRAGKLGDDAFGVYAMPVLPNFFASHQWLR